jgi:parallel beta-helix repeat protein
MKRVFRLLALAVGAAFMATLVVAMPASAKTIDVSPGQSIQAAIDSAHAGDTIVVHPGTYRENVRIDKDWITLRGSGASADGTVLVPPAHPKGFFGGEGISIYGVIDNKGNVKKRSYGVHVSGFLVKGFRDFGMFAYGASQFVIEHNNAMNNGEYGISGFNLQRGEFLYNTASGSGEAGFYWGDSPIARAVIRGNVAFDNKLGILVRDSNRGAVQDNHVHDNCMGILLLNTGSPNPVARWTVTGNQSYHNDHFCKGGKEGPAFSGTGIGVAGARNITLADNTVWANRPTKKVPFPGGIVIISSKSFGGAAPTHVATRDNQLYKNRAFDISYDGSGSGNTFKGNKCDRSKPSGLCN